MYEKRPYPRAPLHTEILLGQNGIFTRARQAFQADVSEGDAFVETADGIPVGSVLSIGSRLPGAIHSISCAASVRNLRNGGAGVQFLDLSQDGRHLGGVFVSDGGTEFPGFGAPAECPATGRVGSAQMMALTKERALSSNTEIPVQIAQKSQL